MNGVNDQISSRSTKRPRMPAARPRATLKGSARNSWWKTAGTESTAPPSMAHPGPTRRPIRMTVSNEISAARKLGTVVRTHTPKVSGTSKKASSAAVWSWWRRSANKSRWNVRDRASALATAAATPSFTRSVMRISLLSSTLSLYRAGAYLRGLGPVFLMLSLVGTEGYELRPAHYWHKINGAL